MGVRAHRVLPATLTCSLRGPDDAGSPDSLLARVARDFGDAPGSVADDGTVVLDAAALPGGGDPARLAWAVAQWAVAVASTEHVTDVAVADQAWARDGDAWAASGTDPLPPGQVRVTLAGG